MTYKCTHCSRTFATPYGLKRHISAKHQFINEDEGESSSRMPYEEPGLWDDYLPTDEYNLWENDDLLTEDQNKENDPFTLEQPIETQETDKESEKSNETNEEINEEIDEEIDEEINDNLTFPLIIDFKDSHGTTLDDAIK